MVLKNCGMTKWSHFRFNLDIFLVYVDQCRPRQQRAAAVFAVQYVYFGYRHWNCAVFREKDFTKCASISYTDIFLFIKMRQHIVHWQKVKWQKLYHMFGGLVYLKSGPLFFSWRLTCPWLIHRITIITLGASQRGIFLARCVRLRPQEICLLAQGLVQPRALSCKAGQRCEARLRDTASKSENSRKL